MGKWSCLSRRRSKRSTEVSKDPASVTRVAQHSRTPRGSPIATISVPPKPPTCRPSQRASGISGSYATSISTPRAASTSTRISLSSSVTSFGSHESPVAVNMSQTSNKAFVPSPTKLTQLRATWGPSEKSPSASEITFAIESSHTRSKSIPSYIPTHVHHHRRSSSDYQVDFQSVNSSPGKSQSSQLSQSADPAAPSQRTPYYHPLYTHCRVHCASKLRECGICTYADEMDESHHPYYLCCECGYATGGVGPWNNECGSCGTPFCAECEIECIRAVGKEVMEMLVEGGCEENCGLREGTSKRRWVKDVSRRV